MADTTGPRAGTCTAALPGWQQAIGREGASAVHAAYPQVTQTIKRTNRTHFVLEGYICALLTAKDTSTSSSATGAPLRPRGIITGGYDNETARTVAIRPGETVNAPALIAMFRPIIASNRVGGWREPRQHADLR